MPVHVIPGVLSSGLHPQWWISRPLSTTGHSPQCTENFPSICRMAQRKSLSFLRPARYAIYPPTLHKIQLACGRGLLCLSCWTLYMLTLKYAPHRVEKNCPPAYAENVSITSKLYPLDYLSPAVRNYIITSTCTGRSEHFTMLTLYYVNTCEHFTMFYTSVYVWSLSCESHPFSRHSVEGGALTGLSCYW